MLLETDQEGSWLLHLGYSPIISAAMPFRPPLGGTWCGPTRRSLTNIRHTAWHGMAACGNLWAIRRDALLWHPGMGLENGGKAWKRWKGLETVERLGNRWKGLETMEGLETVERLGNGGKAWKRWKRLETVERLGNDGKVWKTVGKKLGDPFPRFPPIPACWTQRQHRHS